MTVTRTSSPASKIHPVSMDRNTAQVRAPAETTGQAENKIEIYTYVTKVQPSGSATPVLYNGDRMWARVTLTLEGAGPVAVGQQSQITPVLSGKGQLLQTNVPTTFNIAKGNRLYIAADSVQRVKVTVEAYPWLETFAGLLSAMAGVIKAPVAAAVATMAGKITGKAG